MRKYDVPENWEETCDGQGCRCSAQDYGDCGCPGVDWTPREVYELRIEVDDLLERLEYVRQARDLAIARYDSVKGA